jgi:hypothetical protein
MRAAPVLTRMFEEAFFEEMPVIYNDGGRRQAGYAGSTGDCVTRAIAIATGIPYQQVYDEINVLCKEHDARKRKHKNRKSSSRTGVPMKVIHKYLLDKNFMWVACMGIGTGCTTNLRKGVLPNGTLIVRLSRHVAAVIDNVIHDTHNPQRGGTRCVYGYYKLITPNTNSK